MYIYMYMYILLVHVQCMYILYTALVLTHVAALILSQMFQLPSSSLLQWQMTHTKFSTHIKLKCYFKLTYVATVYTKF